jgi:hypothetical protein
MITEQLREGHKHAYEKFYSLPSMARRFPRKGSRSRAQWSIYNLFYRKGEVTGRTLKEAIAAPTAAPRHAPNPPLLPIKREWREAVLEGLQESRVMDLTRAPGHHDGNQGGHQRGGEARAPSAADLMARPFLR